MKKYAYIILALIMIPTLGFGQLKKDVTKPKISESLVAYNQHDAMVGFLDPSRFQMGHNVSVSYMGFGGGGAIINTYVNTLNYRFTDNLFLTTKLGIMNMPYNSLPGNNYMNDTEFFGGAELKFLPSENSMIILSVEKVPSVYSTGYFHPYRSPFGFNNREW